MQCLIDLGRPSYEAFVADYFDEDRTHRVLGGTQDRAGDAKPEIRDAAGFWRSGSPGGVHAGSMRELCGGT